MTSVKGIFIMLALLAPFAPTSWAQERTAFLCEDGTPCPMGMALVRSPMERCLGFVASDGFLYTASHCLPEAIRHRGARCDQTMEITLLGNDEWPSVAAHCLFVEYATALPEALEHETATPEANSTVHGVHQDWARLRVALPDQRPRLVISGAGIRDGARFRLPHAHREEEGLYIYQEQNCWGIQRSVTLPSFVHDLAPLALVGDCTPHERDSGAPLLDDQNRVHGIQYAAQWFYDWRPDHIEKEYELPASIRPHIAAEVAPAAVAFISNLACLSRGHCLENIPQLQSLERAALAAMASQIERRGLESRVTLDSHRRPVFERSP